MLLWEQPWRVAAVAAVVTRAALIVVMLATVLVGSAGSAEAAGGCPTANETQLATEEVDERVDLVAGPQGLFLCQGQRRRRLARLSAGARIRGVLGPDTLAVAERLRSRSRACRGVRVRTFMRRSLRLRRHATLDGTRCSVSALGVSRAGDAAVLRRGGGLGEVVFVERPGARSVTVGRQVGPYLDVNELSSIATWQNGPWRPGLGGASAGALLGNRGCMIPTGARAVTGDSQVVAYVHQVGNGATDPFSGQVDGAALACRRGEGVARVVTTTHWDSNHPVRYRN